MHPSSKGGLIADKGDRMIGDSGMGDFVLLHFSEYAITDEQNHFFLIIGDFSARFSTSVEMTNYIEPALELH